MELQLAHKFSGHQGAVYGLCHGRNADTFFSASGDGFAVEWNAQTLSQEKFAVKSDSSVYCVLFVADYSLLLLGNSSGGLHVIHTGSRKELKLLKLGDNGIYDILYDNHRSLVYVAGGDGIFTVVSLPALQVVRSIPLCEKKLRQIAMHPNGDSLAVACGDGSIRFLELHFFNETRTLLAHEGGANAISWFAEKNVWLSGGKDARLKIWGNGVDDSKAIIDLPAHNFAIYKIVFAPDGESFATVSRDKTIKIWDAKSLSVHQRLESINGGHKHSVNDAIWLDNNRLITCSDDRQIALFVKKS